MIWKYIYMKMDDIMFLLLIEWQYTLENQEL